jgi:transcriptional/translational regulatory protein YebC/TACO1
VTDNKNRSASNIRHIFAKNGGSLGAVMWNFEQKGVFMIDQAELTAKNISFDDLELELIDNGAADIQQEAEGVTIYTALVDFQKMFDFLEQKGLKMAVGELQYVAKEKINPSAADQEKIEKFIGELDDNEDVSDYYVNADL